MRTARTVLLTLLTLAALGLAGAFVAVNVGLYDVAATKQHFQPVFSVLERAMRQSVRLRARDIEPPAHLRLDDPQLLARGAGCFRDKCVQCHGAPGVAQQDFGQSMQPLPGPLVDAMQHWQPREIYWLTRHGIRMSGMPAWQYHLSDEDIWAVTAFVRRLPGLSPQQYAKLVMEDAAPACPSPASMASPVAASRVPDARRGKLALTQHACSACHTIPGIAGSSPQVGPPLAGIAGRTLIAGRLPHTPQNMVRWITRTHEVDPRSAMPPMGVTEADARDMAAYLATLD